MALYKLVRQAAKFSTNLLSNQLPPNMRFHNLLHTQYVVNAVTEIGFNCKLNDRDMAVVQTAAWFHDSGYCYAYLGHEDNSIGIAATFLKHEDAEGSFTDEVVACITATKMPQSPQNLLQQIMCDADMFHLADDDYPAYASRLRTEWELVLSQRYSDEQWRQTNLNMLIQHKYFTDYGKTTLQQHKLANIDKLLR
ncbi:uncharacterized protein ACVW0P_002287 [Mucilaginibacter sp. UYNi724]